MTTKLLARLLLGLAVVGALAAFAASGPSTVTRPRLERSLPASFANQYVRQATILGHRGVTVGSLNARAQCDKGGPRVADEGVGADWICFMDWQDPNVPVPDGSAKFELNVHSNGCFTATGPTKLVGLRTITNARGEFVDNPAFEFDTCLDPGASTVPTGVVFPPAALTLPTGTVRADPDGTVSPGLTCTVGPIGCSGRVTARVGGRSLGTRAYSLAPGGASVARFAVRPGERGGLRLDAQPTVGGARPRSTTLRLR